MWIESVFSEMHQVYLVEIHGMIYLKGWNNNKKLYIWIVGLLHALLLADSFSSLESM